MEAHNFVGCNLTPPCSKSDECHWSNGLHQVCLMQRFHHQRMMETLYPDETRPMTFWEWLGAFLPPR